jgi:hypothetical protein
LFATDDDARKYCDGHGFGDEQFLELDPVFAERLAA